jgi:hypothetical protein
LRLTGNHPKTMIPNLTRIKKVFNRQRLSPVEYDALPELTFIQLTENITLDRQSQNGIVSSS